MSTIIELNPGLYKVVKRDQVKSSREVHLLRVTGQGETRKYFIDHDAVGEHPHNFNMDEYQVLKKYTPPPAVLKPKIFITFQDEDFHEFTFSMRDAWALKGAFEELPWLKDAFNYKPNKSREVKQEQGTPMFLPKHVKSKRTPGSDWGKSRT